MVMPGRSYTSDNYRYGFNGMEKDDEMKGSGNSYTTLFRQYDPRVGRWMSVDPKASKYPGMSPYNAFHNNPIFHTDPFGDDPPEKTKTHIVNEGETLSGIAEESGASVDDIMKWNEGKINDKDEIIAGDNLYTSDPKRWIATDNGRWSDTQNPEERWANENGEWVDVNAQTFGEWLNDLSNKPNGYTDKYGERTVSKTNEDGKAMMQITREVVPAALGNAMTKEQTVLEFFLRESYNKTQEKKQGENN